MDDQLTKNTTIYISSRTHLNLTFNLLQCGVNVFSPGGLLSVAPTDTFTVMCIRTGSILLESNGLAFRLTEQQGFFCFPDVQYNLQNLGDTTCELVWLTFTGYLVENYLIRANISRTRPVFADPDSEVVARLNRLYEASQHMPNRYCRMAAILYDTFSYLLDKNPTKNPDGGDSNTEFYAAKAVDYIERNYAKSLSVDEIATALGISRKHLYAIFNDAIKISPKQYLIYYRLEKACMRLKSTTQSVMEIAESVGYANQFYFAREFKRLVGSTPTEYRRNPDVTAIFSYRAFVPTLKEKLEDKSMDLPLDEDLISVYLPPQPAGTKRGLRDKKE